MTVAPRRVAWVLAAVVASTAWAVPCDPPMQCIPACSVVTTSTLVGPPDGIGGLVVAGDNACEYGAPFATSFEHINDTGVFTIAGTIALQNLVIRGGSPVAYGTCLCAGPVTSAHDERTTEVRWCGCGVVGATTTIAPTTTTAPTTSSTSSTTSTSSTSAPSTSSSTTTSTSGPSTTSTLDGGAMYDGGDDSNLSGTASHYLGGVFLVAHDPAQSESVAWWATGRAYTHVSGRAILGAAPGTGKTWTFTLVYSETPVGASEACGDHLTSTVSTPLCAISNTTTQRNCTFDVDLTAVNGGLGIAAGSCFQIAAVPTGTPASSGMFVGLSAIDATTDAITNFATASLTSNAATTFLGPLATTNTTDLNGYWMTTKAATACAGMLALDAAPGVGSSWQYTIDVSTTGLTAAQSCSDLTYTAVPGCTISNTDKQCHFALTSMAIPARGCIHAKRVAVGSPIGTGGQTYSIECSAQTTDPATAGPAPFVGLGGGAMPAAGWYLGQYAANNHRTGTGWRTGAQGFTKCSGVYRARTTGGTTTGTTVTLKLAVSTSVPSTATCGTGPTFTDTTLCTVAVGSEKGCSFDDVAVSIPPYACIYLRAIQSDVPTAYPAEAHWILTCAP